MGKLTPTAFRKKLKATGKRLNELMVRAMNKTTIILRKQVIREHFSVAGKKPTATAVRTQSGGLKRAIVFSKAESIRGIVSANLSINKRYGGIHVSNTDKLSMTTIRSKRKNGFLAIPTDYARRASGVPIAAPRDPRWGRTRIIQGTIFGQVGGNEVPLFNLKKSVKVPQRVSMTRDVLAPGRRIYIQQLITEIKKVL